MEGKNAIQLTWMAFCVVLKGRGFSRAVSLEKISAGFTDYGKSRFCSCFCVAQRFTAAILGSFSATVLAAEGGGAHHWFFQQSV